MRAVITFAAAVLLVAALIAGCRFIVPADGSPPLPEPGFSGAPRLSPSLEIPPPID